jgi:hypothetical protein
MLKKILGNWHRYVLWALLSGILWAWIIVLVTRTDASEEVRIYADLPTMRQEALELALEREKPDGIRYVEAQCFDDAIIDASAVMQGDLYLIPESKAEKYLASFAPIEDAETLFPKQTFYESDGKAYGIVVFDEDAGIWIGKEYVMYIAEERCFLFFNKDSKHIGAWNGSPDDAAITIAKNFLKLED